MADRAVQRRTSANPNPANRRQQGAEQRDRQGRFPPGVSGNPTGRPRIVKDIRDLARSHADAAVETLVHIAKSGKQESARVAAATALLDRGYGKPTQPVVGDDDLPPVGVAVAVMTAAERAAEIEQRRQRALRLLGEAFGAEQGE